MPQKPSKTTRLARGQRIGKGNMAGLQEPKQKIIRAKLNKSRADTTQSRIVQLSETAPRIQRVAATGSFV